MATRTTDPIALWRTIHQAGGADAYIESQLREHGFLVERRDATTMSKRELGRYKKELKAEAAEKKRLKAETWAAYKANHIVHLGEGVFYNEATDLDKWDLDNADERRAENDLPSLEKPANLAEALGLTVAELRSFTYHRDAASFLHYQRFTIPKGNGEERAIWAPLPKLKAAQRYILTEIVERLPVHGAAHGFMPGRSIVTNASVHTGSRLILSMDIKDFFPTVTLSRVKGVFRHAGYREQIATLLALLCTEAPREVVEDEGKTWFVAMGPRSLPQGAPTSPGITNVLCMRLDRRLQGLAARLGWRYTRYADDLTFSLPLTHEGAPRLGTLLGCVTRITEDEGFSIHAKKTHVMRTGARQQVTGLVVNGTETPRVPRPLRRQLRAAVHNLEQGKPLKEGDFPARMIGYAAFVNMTDVERGAALLQKMRALLATG